MAERDDEEEESSKPQKKQKHGNINIQDPMFVWIGFLLVAVVVKVILSSTTLIPANSQSYSLISILPNFLLQFPGITVLPLIAGAIIGAEVGIRSRSIPAALKNGLLNGIYAAVIYIVAIVVIYVIISYTSAQATAASIILLNNILIPIAVLLIVLEAFAVLSYSRKVEE